MSHQTTSFKPMMRLSKDQIRHKQEFIRRYMDVKNASSGSLLDANANVSKKTIATLGAELQKDMCIQLNRQTLYDYIEKQFGTDLADEYIRMIESHVLYKNDESSSTPGTAYCVAINMYPFLESGMTKMGGESKAPKHLESFCGSFNNLIFAISSEFNGAVAAVEFPLYFHYFAQKDYGKDYLKTHPDMIKSKLQHVVYTLNQPAAARGYQSVFFNISFFDRYFFDSMFGNFYFPDEQATHIGYDEFNEFQKFFMEWLLEERKKSLLTFPVITEASLNLDGKPKDQEWAEFCADIRSRGLSFFSFNDDTPSSLSSCCYSGNEIIEVYDTHLGDNYFTAIGDLIDRIDPEEKLGEQKVKTPFLIKSFNPDTKELEMTEIVGILRKPYSGKMYVFWVHNHYISVTDDHKFMVRNILTNKLETLPAATLAVNYKKYLMPFQATDSVIIDVPIDGYHIDEPDEDIVVYDIELKKNHWFFADNMLASNCRLKNELDVTDFSYSLGAGGVSTGSTSVMTLNVNRFVQDTIKETGSEDKPLEEKNQIIISALTEIIRKIQKFQVAHRKIVEDYVNAGLITTYTAGFITLDKQFVTIGINGLNEAAEYLGYTCSNNEEYLSWVANFLGHIRDLNKEARQEFGIKFNTELIPAENLGPKNANWDRKDGYQTKRNCYNSYIYLPESDNTSIPDKFKMHGGIIADSLDGGSALHLNLSGLPDKEFFLWLRNLAAKYHTTYWTTNVKTTFCNNCQHIDMKTLETCPACGSDDLDYATRIIGYCKKLSSYSHDRQEEEKLRFYH